MHVGSLWGHASKCQSFSEIIGHKVTRYNFHSKQRTKLGASARIGKRSFFDLVTSGFDLGNLRFTFETPRPNRSMNQPKLGKKSFFDLVTSGFDLGDLRFTCDAAKPHKSTNQPKLRKDNF